MKVRRAVAGAVFAAVAGTLAGTGVAQATPPTPTPLLAHLLHEESLVQSWKADVEAPVVKAIDDWNAGTANTDLLYCDDWNPGPHSERELAGAENCSTGHGGWSYVSASPEPLLPRPT